jgi:hypothetical protein
MGTLAGPTTLYSLAETTIGALVNGSAYSVATAPQAINASVAIYVAQVNSTAPSNSTTSNPPNRIVLQGNQYASDDAKWFDLFQFSTNLTASNVGTTSAAISAGATSFSATSGLFGSLSKALYLRDSSSAGEWVRMQNQSGTTVTVPSPGVVNAHGSGINGYDQTFKFCASGFDVSSLLRLRLQVDNNQQSTGPTLAVLATVETFG